MDWSVETSLYGSPSPACASVTNINLLFLFVPNASSPLTLIREEVNFSIEISPPNRILPISAFSFSWSLDGFTTFTSLSPIKTNPIEVSDPINPFI